jgi:beta-lactamase regulating signal transducer with metallopeptidase domain
MQLLNHLWQSTLFAAALALLSLAFRKNHARTRYALWLAASLKFLVPFSLLISLGQQFAPKSPPQVIEQRTLIMVERTERTPPLPFVELVSSAEARRTLPLVLFAIWLFGVSAVAFRTWSGWRRIRGWRRP